MTEPDQYVLGYRAAEQQRLQRQAQQLANESSWLFDRIGIADANGTFDLATARLVLVNIPHPEQVVAEAVALVRPGGWVAFHEADYVSRVCDPPSEAWTRLLELLQVYSQRNGIDPWVGRKVPRLLREAGLVEINVNPIVHVYPPDHGRRRLLLDFAENLSERIVAEGLVDEQVLTELKEALARHLTDPDTLVVSHLYFQVWGRKPS